MAALIPRKGWPPPALSGTGRACGRTSSVMVA